MTKRIMTKIIRVNDFLYLLKSMAIFLNKWKISNINVITIKQCPSWNVIFHSWRSFRMSTGYKRAYSILNILLNATIVFVFIDKSLLKHNIFIFSWSLLKRYNVHCNGNYYMRKQLIYLCKDKYYLTCSIVRRYDECIINLITVKNIIPHKNGSDWNNQSNQKTNNIGS